MFQVQVLLSFFILIFFINLSSFKIKNFTCIIIYPILNPLIKKIELTQETKFKFVKRNLIPKYLSVFLAPFNIFFILKQKVLLGICIISQDLFFNFIQNKF